MHEPLSAGQRRWRVRVFAATWSSYAGFYFCRKNFGIVKADLRDALQVTDLEIAHVWTAYLAAYMAGQFLSAWLGRRMACRTLLLTGMAISALCNVVFGFAALAGPASYWPLLAFMVINGFAQATGWPGNIGVMASWFRRDERGMVMGVWATCYQVGSFLAKWFTAFMFAWLGLVWSFWGASLALFAVWLLGWRWLRDQPEDVGLPPILPDVQAGVEPAAADPAAADRDARPAGAGGPKPPAVDVWIVVAVMGAAYFSFKFLRYAVESWAPMLLKESFGLPTDTAGYVSSLFDIFGFASVLASGYLTDRLWGGRRAVLAFILAAGMVLSAVYLWALGPTAVFHFGLGLALIGFTLYGPDSLLSAVGAIDVGSRRGAATVAGVINGLGSLGGLLQEELLGWVKTYQGSEAVFAVLVGVAALGAVGTGVLWRWSATGRAQF